MTKNEDNSVFLSKNTKFNMTQYEYFIDNEIVNLPKSETKLLQLLCESRNKDISAYDIFIHVWDDFDKEFSSDSVRTLIKKLRKKLPEGVLNNSYGGYYKLVTK